MTTHEDVLPTLSSNADALEDGLPAGCILPPEERPERLAWIRREVASRVVRRLPAGEGMDWELADEPGLAACLDRLIELEGACCSELVIRHELMASGSRRLEVRGLGAQAAAPLGFDGELEAGGEPGPLARVVRAASVGTAVSLFVCCVLPMAAPLVVGASVAAGLAWLDRPAVVVGVGLALTVTLLLRSRRPPAVDGASTPPAG